MESNKAAVAGIVIAIALVAIVAGAYILYDGDERHRVTFLQDDGTVYSTFEVEDGTIITQPNGPIVSDEEQFRFITGWYDIQGEKWDFDDPVTSNLFLSPTTERLLNVDCRGFYLFLNIDLEHRDWTVDVSWGDGTTSSYPEEVQPYHQYSESGTYTITTTITDPDGNVYTAQHPWEPYSDSRGNLVPYADTMLSTRASYDITNVHGNRIGSGEMHIYGHDIRDATFNGSDLSPETIDAMNRIRDLSKSVISSDGMWRYTTTDYKDSPVYYDYEVYRIQYDSDSYDLISENGRVIAVHVGGDVNLNYDWDYWEVGNWEKL